MIKIQKVLKLEPKGRDGSDVLWETGKAAFLHKMHASKEALHAADATRENDAAKQAEADKEEPGTNKMKRAGGYWEKSSKAEIPIKTATVTKAKETAKRGNTTSTSNELAAPVKEFSSRTGMCRSRGFRGGI